MATPEQDVLREMAGLLGAMTDAALDDAERRRLAQLVREEPEARRLYLDYCQMHALLRSAHGVLAALEPPAGQRRRRVGWRAVGVAVLALAATAALVVWVVSPTDGLQPAITSASGEVQILRDGQRIPADAGGRIRSGERLLTGPNASVQLHLADGTSIRVGGSTDVGFVQEKAARQVQLRTGVMHCEVTEQPPGQPLVFQTPHAELTVLGTAFELLATPVESRVRVLEGRVRWTAGGRSVEVAAGEASTANIQGVQAWQPVCDLDFSTLQSMPPQLETVYCDSPSLHTAQRKIVPAPGGVRLEDGSLRFVDSRQVFGEHGLLVTRWAEPVGGDVAIEVDVAAGEPWSMGLSVDGDSFQGYRIIFIAPNYPNGINVDSIYPVEATLLAQDPRPISTEQDHTLRVEKRGAQLRVWVDQELRIDTELSYPLAPDRKQTFAISSFGVGPQVRALRVWKSRGG
ncbi:MAG: FecR domain-containing protein [Pirellulaceae bacterium]|nr:FecR domain-containing protein [Pirellulaceae bacterium]